MKTGLLRRVLASSSWPLGLTLQVSVVGLAGWSDPDLVGRAMGLTTVAFLLVLLALEQVLPYRQDWSIRGDAEIWRDLGHAVLYASLGGTLAQLTFLAGFPSALTRLGFPGGLGIWPASSPVVLQVLAVVVLGDLLEYWYHRLAHTVSWLWPVHAIHHTPIRLNTLKGPRHHVVYYLGRGAFVWAPLLVIGVPPRLVAWQFVAIVLFGSLAHANIAFRIPVFVHRIFITPDVHRIHHLIDARHGNSNYATVFPIWDLLFGSYTDPRVVDARETGIYQDPIPRRFLSELLSPLTFHRLAGSAAAPGAAGAPQAR
jgi:sterol desaturase/sphingolipid hydroxylase (fatty acid hydroxylase superfamily)